MRCGVQCMDEFYSEVRGKALQGATSWCATRQGAMASTIPMCISLPRKVEEHRLLLQEAHLRQGERRTAMQRKEGRTPTVAVSAPEASSRRACPDRVRPAGAAAPKGLLHFLSASGSRS
jgi:hypothetical protein